MEKAKEKVNCSRLFGPTFSSSVQIRVKTERDTHVRKREGERGREAREERETEKRGEMARKFKMRTTFLDCRSVSSAALPNVLSTYPMHAGKERR